jgi:hypothetical protein
MITNTINRVTGLPLVQEHRNRIQAYHALPRKFFTFAFGDKTTPPGQTWVKDWQQWEGTTLQRVRCWKCGADIKGWRVALDPAQNPIKVNGQPAVTFTVLNHFAQTPMSVFLPAMQEKVTFSVLHCADCVIQDAHAMEALTCYLQGLDAQLQRAWRYNHGQQVTRDDWASHLMTWSTAEPIGVLKMSGYDDRLNSLNQELIELRKEEGARLPTPGELLTAAHYLTDVFSWRYAGIPTGSRVKFDGDPPAGWIRAVPGQVDAERYPELAKVSPSLPDEEGWIVKL